MHVDDAPDLRPSPVDAGMDEDLVGNVQVICTLELPSVQVDGNDVPRLGEPDSHFAGTTGLDENLVGVGQANANVAGLVGQVQLARHPAGACQKVLGRSQLIHN